MFGSTFLAISLGLKAGATPLFFAALRYIAAGGTMLPALFLAQRVTMGSVSALAGRSAFFSLFMTVGTFGCMFIAQTRVDSGFMARLDATGPLVTALLAALLLGKKPTFPHLIAFTLGTAGGFLIATPAANADILYLGLAAGSVVAYAGGNVLYPLIFHKDEDPILISALQSLVGGFILMAAALVTETIRFPLAALGPFIYLVLGGSVIGHTAALALVRDTGPVFASTWLYVAPVLATVLGALVLEEPITVPGIFGMVMALAGVFILGVTQRY